MTKRQLIDRVMELNETATPEFLAKFGGTELSDYFNHLLVLQTPRLSGDPSRYDRYFDNCPSISVPFKQMPAEHLVVDYPEMDFSEPVCQQEPVAEEVHEAVEAVEEEAFAESVEDQFTEEFTEEIEEIEKKPAEPVAVGVGAADDASSFAESTEETESWLF